MPWDSVPWLVGGGAEHSPEVARVLAYAALGGAEGVIGINDCKVSALATPGTSIRVATGSVAMLNRSTGGTSQEYVGRCSTEDVVPVTANGPGATRYDLVIARVEDPQYPPWTAPADPKVGPYIKTHIVTGVSASTVNARTLNLGYPAIALARLAIPASTATITQAMITDLRKVARPRRERYMRTTALTTEDTDSLGTYPPGEVWPDASGLWTMDIPEWATSARIQAVWSQVVIPIGSNRFGGLWVRLGSSTTVDTQKVAFDTRPATNTTRSTWIVADDIAIPTALRGTTAPTKLWGDLNASSTGPFIYLDKYSSISLDIEFLERADLA